MSYTLFKHQAEAAHLLTSSSAMLEWEMRVGKTRAALHAWDVMLDRGQPMDLVVATLKGARAVWREEAEGMDVARLPWTNLFGTKPAWAEARHEVMLPRALTLNWEVLPAWRHQLVEMERGRKFILVLDESHLNLRNPGNQRWKAAHLLSKLAHRTWLLTGTSMVKTAEDIYWQLQMLGHDNPLLGMSLQRFRTRYCQRVFNPFKGTEGAFEYKGSKNLKELAERLPVVSSIKESDVRDVPLPVHLPVYLDEKHEFVAAGLKDKEIERRLVKLAPLRGKLAVDYISRLEDRPLIVFAWHREVVEHIASMLEAPMITGDTSQADRDRIRRAFQNGEIPVLVGNYRAMGMGIDLSRASHAVLAEPWYDAAMVAQSLARLKGPKQLADEVIYHHLLVAGTVDEHVWRVRLKRGAAIEQLRTALGEAAFTN